MRLLLIALFLLLASPVFAQVVGSSQSTPQASSSVTLATPSGTQVGDYLIANISWWGNGPSGIATAGGWTSLAHGGSSANNAQENEAFGRVATSADASGANYTWNSTGGTIWVGGSMHDVRGVSAVDVAQGGTSSKSSTSPSLTTTQAGDLLMTFWGMASSGFRGPTDESQVTLSQYTNNGTEGFYTGTKQLGAAGPVASEQAASGNGSAVSVALVTGSPIAAIKPELSLALIDQSTPTSLWGPSGYTYVESALRIQIDAVNHYYQTDHRAVIYNFGDTAPATAWPIYVRNECNLGGTDYAGFHAWDANTLIPFACVSTSYNDDASGMAGLMDHETSEMMGDPYTGLPEIVDTVYLHSGSFINTVPNSPLMPYNFQDFLLPTPQNGFTDYLQQVPN
jgi:hypothetical protein